MGLSKPVIILIAVGCISFVIFAALLGVGLPIWWRDRQFTLEIVPDAEGGVISVTKQNWGKWTQIIHEHLYHFYLRRHRLGAEKQVECDHFNTAPRGQYCLEDLSSWKQCSAHTNYGYSSGQPCIFIYPKKLHGWVPNAYNATDELPLEMPSSLAEHIKTIQNEPYNREMLNAVWLSCNTDSEEALGPVEYIPMQGFPAYYFPSQENDGYLSPIVAVRFLKPPQCAVTVECKAWAKNIAVDTSSRIGSIRFLLDVNFTNLIQ